MSKEKQIIKAMAKDLCDIQYKGMKCHICYGGCECHMLAEALYNVGYRKQSEDERFEAVDMFRNLLTNKFIELCNYNDYGKINLLLIGEAIDRIYDDVVAKMKGGAE